MRWTHVTNFRVKIFKFLTKFTKCIKFYKYFIPSNNTRLNVFAYPFIFLFVIIFYLFFSFFRSNYFAKIRSRTSTYKVHTNGFFLYFALYVYLFLYLLLLLMKLVSNIPPYFFHFSTSPKDVTFLIKYWYDSVSILLRSVSRHFTTLERKTKKETRNELTFLITYLPFLKQPYIDSPSLLKHYVIIPR